MEDNPTHHLDIEMALADGSPGSLTDCCKGFGEDGIKAFTGLEAAAEFVGLRAMRHHQGPDRLSSWLAIAAT